MDRISSSFQLRRRLVALALALLPLALESAAAQQPARAPQTFHVAPFGVDGNPGTAEQPWRSLQRSVDRILPGDTVLVHAGTYTGVLDITHPGKPEKPMVLRAAGDGTATLTATLPQQPCSATGPTLNRTVVIRDGADHWVIQGFEIVGGILVIGTNPANLSRSVWDRSIAGRSMYDPTAASSTLESLGSNAADYIYILDNRIRDRGIFAAASRYGRIEGNEIYDIACGTGGGVWIGSFSDRWVVRRNYVHDIADSGNHWMTEGIRFGSNAMYNLVERNLVERLPGEGRGITTDANSGWNLIRLNRVRDADMGFSEQQGSWGNRWARNVSENNRTTGFKVGPPVTQADEKTPRYTVLQCNQSVGDQVALTVGSAAQAIFNSNDFPTVQVYNGFEAHWPQTGNRWDGRPNLPPASPSTEMFQRNCGMSR